MRYCQMLLACIFTYLSLTTVLAQAEDASTSGFGAPRITAISFFDDGKLPTDSATGEPLIDTIRGSCGQPSTTPEPFYDTLVSFSIVNPGSSTLILSSYSFSVNRGSGSRLYKSKSMGFTGNLEIPPGETATVFGLLFQAKSSRKLFPRSSVEIGQPGFRTVRFTVRGRQGNRSVSLSGSSGVSFSDYDRCS